MDGIDPISDKYEKKHLLNIARTNERIREVFSEAINVLTLSAGRIRFNGEVFDLSKYPALKAQIAEVIAEMQPAIYTAIVNSIEASWGLSNEKNDVLVDRRLAGKKVPPGTAAVLYDPNRGALEAFVKRKDKGLNLSDRVWNALEPMKTELEKGLALGISEGKPAREMAKEIKQFLNEPDKLFRRVRDAKGKLKLSKAAKEYHPGQGVYRSSFKNAFRVARTETNMAYRNADFERWNSLPFVTGIEVKLSNTHPLYDICDEVKGKYPKEFKFTGWHPQCKCHAIPIMVSDEDYEKIEDALLAGEEPPKFTGVTEPPKGFKDYIRDNKDRINGWSNTPYWVKDNPQFTEGLKAAGKAKVVPITPKAPPKPAFTPAKTLKEAEEFALTNGLAKSVNYKGLKDVEIANETNKVLLEMKGQGVVYDNITSIRKATNKNGREKYMLQNHTELDYDDNGKVKGERHTLILNKAFFDKNPTLADVNKVAKGMRERQWAAAESYQDLVWHEMGHRLTAKNVFLNKNTAKFESLVFDYDKLGRYATKNLDENLAEIFAFHKKTGKAPKEWIDLFNKYSIVKL